MKRIILAAACLLVCWVVWGQSEKHKLPSFDHSEAEEHEIAPHRRAFRVEGVNSGFNQLHVDLTVSNTGAVIDAEAGGNLEMMKFWPQLRVEVLAWKFKPFEVDGKAVMAEVEEFIEIYPPERLPNVHAAAPAIRADSKITITLRRTGCYGTCASYTVKVGPDGIVFDGDGYVVAYGKHTDSVKEDEVRKFAEKFVTGDFYSMDDSYRENATDLPTYVVSIEIDGHKKEVEDYAGRSAGMPEVVTELEQEVDEFARTARWVDGDDGLVQTLRAERFDFRTFEAQVMLKGAASGGKSATVREFLQAGVPLKPLPAPKPKERYLSVRFSKVGWLGAASNYPDVLRILVTAGASRNDQDDKDLALAGAAESGRVEGARELIAYGANPNADLRKKTVSQGVGMTSQQTDAGSVLSHAAASGNPEMVREILKYHPDLEARDSEGKTAVFAAGDWRNEDKEGPRVECVRLLARAGANVNARDEDGNTPLHETFLTEVAEELLKLGANVNARNKDGETPIFTNVDDDAIGLFIEHGADLTIRNKKGQTVMEAAKGKGPAREKALREAIEKMKKEKK